MPRGGDRARRAMAAVGQRHVERALHAVRPVRCPTALLREQPIPPGRRDQLRYFVAVVAVAPPKLCGNAASCQAVADRTMDTFWRQMKGGKLFSTGWDMNANNVDAQFAASKSSADDDLL
jgi:hypothetical protein